MIRLEIMARNASNRMNDMIQSESRNPEIQKSALPASFRYQPCHNETCNVSSGVLANVSPSPTFNSGERIGRTIPEGAMRPIGPRIWGSCGLSSQVETESGCGVTTRQTRGYRTLSFSFSLSFLRPSNHCLPQQKALAIISSTGMRVRYLGGTARVLPSPPGRWPKCGPRSCFCVPAAHSSLSSSISGSIPKISVAGCCLARTGRMLGTKGIAPGGASPMKGPPPPPHAGTVGAGASPPRGLLPGPCPRRPSRWWRWHLRPP
jgi:hypothetical protein